MPKRIAVLKFDNTALDEIRTKSSNINIVVVEGLELPLYRWRSWRLVFGGYTTLGNRCPESSA